MKRLFIIPFLLTGCATHYNAYTSANVKIAEARAQAEIARSTALADIAKSSDPVAKVAAAMGLALSAPQAHTQTLQAPKEPADLILQALAVALPSIAQVYGINRQVALGMEQVRGNVAIQQSVGATSVANTASTNSAFTAIASKIQSNNTTTTTTTTYPTEIVTVDKPFVVQQDKAVFVDKPFVVQQDKTVILKPEVVIVPPTLVNPVIVRPDIVKVETAPPQK
jgi:hypothetical protein